MHEACLYTGMSDLADLIVRLGGRPGLDPPMLAVVSSAVIATLREELGDEDSPRLRLVDIRLAGRNPTRMIPELLRFIDDHPDQPVLVVTEPMWPGRSPAEYATLVQTEALCNVALRKHAATVICAYHVPIVDGVAVHHEIVHDAARTHPVIIETDGERWESLRYADPMALAGSCLHPLPDPPPAAYTLAFDATDLYGLGQSVISRDPHTRLLAERLPDLELAVTEAAAELIAHTGASGRLRIWAEQNVLICELQTRHQLTDALAGRRPSSNTPHGLLVANELCDLVQIDAHPTGTTVRLHITIPRQGLS
ncbi:sensor histidine kinase [Actinopolymorpha pittospori]